MMTELKEELRKKDDEMNEKVEEMKKEIEQLKQENEKKTKTIEEKDNLLTLKLYNVDVEKYSKIKVGEEYYILAEALAPQVIDGEYEVVCEYTGKELEYKEFVYYLLNKIKIRSCLLWN